MSPFHPQHRAGRRRPALGPRALAAAGATLAAAVVLAGCSAPAPAPTAEPEPPAVAPEPVDPNRGGPAETLAPAPTEPEVDPATVDPRASFTPHASEEPPAAEVEPDLDGALARILEARSGADARAVTLEEGLNQIASAQAEHYARGGEGWDGDLGEQLAARGYATGAARARTAQDGPAAVDAWLADGDSAGDLLDGRYGGIGLASARLGDGRTMVVAVLGYRADDGAIAAGSRGAAEALDLTNAERAASGLPALTSSADLDRAAQVQADHQAAILEMTHDGNGGLGSRLGAVGYRAGAENVAVGQRSVGEVVQGWIESPGHHANIVHPDMTEMGFAVAFGTDGRAYWAQVFGNR
ncbi:CAP domain-containing protein [Litorihabitans aurantiacus]|uniref:SCP domain-containing protein n=1 Tax=Litorihabitans aurantiacus TaxID=1930061 RepID=A0AA38CR11_9MICO|nr:CAP domain-containing protein [Litorihabitans aurantiacus]GMA32678.1 hypothetical protein GCM10025875_26700 [Litorihabitans aurantiacus]